MQSSKFTNLVDTLNLSKRPKLDGLGRTFQQGTILDPATTRAIPCGSAPILSPAIAAGCAARAQSESSQIPLINGGAKSAIVRDPYFQELGQPAGCPSLAGTTNWVSTVAGGPVPTSCFNHLPAGRIDPNAVELLQLFKPYTLQQCQYQSDDRISTAGTTATPATSTSFCRSRSTPSNTTYRLDHTFSEGLRIRDVEPIQPDPAATPPTQGLLRAAAARRSGPTNPTYMVVVTETHVFNPHLVNEYRMSDEHNWNTRMDPGTIDNTFGTPASIRDSGHPAKR